MKRSEINLLIRKSIDFFQEMNFYLPPWAYLEPGQWKNQYKICSEIIDHKLGWDLTDFGQGVFLEKGLILFSLRNGIPGKGYKTYAEKIMIVDEMQETPMHFHWNKTEDIINRGGGNLILELSQSNESEELSPDKLLVKIDGISRTLSARGLVTLTPGESICLEPGLYHRFFGEKGKGRVLVGEVSSVNDDNNDNRFYDPVGRFPQIIEDEDPLHLLASDYQRFI
jgi:D-lyxose ketol-isomerase